MSGAHAFLSPSGLDAALKCELKIWMEKDIPNVGSDAAAEGTAAHELAAKCLEGEFDAAYFLGTYIEADGQVFEVDDDMAGFVQQYLDHVRQIVRDTGGELLVEQKLSIEDQTGETGATGTTDVVILAFAIKTLFVRDLKYGRGVQVDAEDNNQLRSYALAALNQFDMIGDFDTIDMGICQPRTGHWPSTTMTATELRAWGAEIRRRADKILAGPDGLEATPNEKSCKFCRGKASCPALQSQVVAIVTDDFVDLTKSDSLTSKLDAAHARIETVDNASLASVMPHLDRIIDWCNAVRAEVTRRVMDGQTVPGFKIVMGKQGNREWGDSNEAAKLLTLADVPDDLIFIQKLISPAQAEKLFKKKLPAVWDGLQEMITQSSGKPAVVEDTDPRPALQLSNSADQFDNLEEQQA